MDDFIDDEINSSEENEPVLLDLKDLLRLKKETSKNEEEKEKENRYKNRIRNDSNFLKYIKNGDSDDNELLIDKRENTINEENKNLEKWGDFQPWKKKNNDRPKLRLKFKNSVISFFSKSKNTFMKSTGIFRNIFAYRKTEEDRFNSDSGILPGEFFHILLNRLYHSKFTSFLYAFVFLLNISILIHGLFTSILSKFIVIAEIFVILMLFFEVSLRMLAEGRNYLHRLDGIFDFTITLMSSLFLINSGDLRVFFKNDSVKTKSTEIEEIISQSLTAIRFSMQLFRMITLVMHHKRTQEPISNIDFSLLNEPFDDF